jgi:hypothetical protein
MVIKERIGDTGYWELRQVPEDTSNPDYGVLVSIDVERLSAMLGLSRAQSLALSQKLWDNNIKWPHDVDGPVFDRMWNIFKQVEGITALDAKTFSNTFIHQIRAEKHGQ